MLNGLDLFSGIGGITIALAPWVRPVAYCEIDRYSQTTLISRMSEGGLSVAPIWDDIRTLRGSDLPEIDILYGGFPCQDISVAGNGIGLEGKRSGLFFEIMRLAEEIKPKFIFLENVPAIRTRGLERVVRELSDRGYDCRWCTLSAKEVGANHNRKRWWLLGYSKHNGLSTTTEQGSTRQAVCHDKEGQDEASKPTGASSSGVLADSERNGLEEQRNSGVSGGQTNPATDSSWWLTEPNVGRVANGVPFRVDRIKCLGNAVVPLQAREAFKILTGIKESPKVVHTSER